MQQAGKGRTFAPGHGPDSCAMAEATLIATLGMPPSPRGEEFAALPASVRWLEARADRIGDPNPDWLRSHFSGRLLYTLRSKDQGGSFEADRRLHQERLAAAAKRYDLVDLESRDLDRSLLEQIAPPKRLLSYQ